MLDSGHAIGRCAQAGCLDSRSLAPPGGTVGGGEGVYASICRGRRGSGAANCEQVGERVGAWGLVSAPVPKTWPRQCVSESVNGTGGTPTPADDSRQMPRSAETAVCAVDGGGGARADRPRMGEAPCPVNRSPVFTAVGVHAPKTAHACERTLPRPDPPVASQGVSRNSSTGQDRGGAHLVGG